MSPQNMIPGIKLFGRKIPVPEGQIPAKPDAGFQIPTESQVTEARGANSNIEAVQFGKSADVESGQEDMAQVSPDNEEDKTETTQHEEEKTFKKPDKILPCPRCNSFDTKFCYFNNYNVNQPRHFCKNCQRYWTAGGTMRNVPVGAGRRKNKQFASSQYRQAVLSVNGMAAPTSGLETPNSANPRFLPPGEFASPLTPPEVRGSAVLKFGPEGTLSESMDSVLNLRDRCRSGERGPVSFSESREEPSSASELESNSSGSCDSNHNPPQQIPALFFPYHSSWQNLATPLGAYPSHFSSKQVYDRNSVQWGSPPMVAIPSVCAQPTIPLQIVPTSYLGYVPFAVLNGCLSPSSSTVTNGGCSGSGSPSLGKHLRDGDVERSESDVLVPKTLRIDDPNEASRSPIWATFGIKPYEKVSSSMVNGKVECQGNNSEDAADIMEANPAALSRSHTFQEST
ncbi:cyclic dof factor 3-like [Punica granatum]|uniref:Dof-type domain-containing protein n=2 Tax=Punica granatum TaxID=22663 RepID=A0A218X1L9_PUNGR|nr:cyclic dof factor 3-like [Punica granatum]OWM78843.1 hypothetical protein CDL15_Pgr003014 [Punica granatum]PKI34971.1 hypothetical protein CRG98_044677 [Punica granatum]